MLHRIASALILSATTLAATPALAANTTGQPSRGEDLFSVYIADWIQYYIKADTTGQPGRGGDGHCPIPGLATDPDCAREGAQTLSKSSRNEFPRCRNGRAGQPLPPGCRKAQAAPGTLLAGRESDKRDQFPTTTPQPGHLG